MADSIWLLPRPLDEVNQRNEHTLATHLGIVIAERGDDDLEATMPVEPRVTEPMGAVHGGANVALAETPGSIAANLAVDGSRFVYVGQEINANHLFRKWRYDLLHSAGGFRARQAQLWQVVMTRHRTGTTSAQCTR